MTRLHITCGEDLRTALRSPDDVVRNAVLRAIAANPAAALAYGPVDGRDLVDLLLQLCDECVAPAARAALAFTVLAFDDPRVVDFAGRELPRATDTRLVLQAARRLCGLPAAERVALLGPLAMNPERPAHARVAANLLAGTPDLPARLALRVALLSDHACPLPAFDAASEAAWLAELDGPYPTRARERLGDQGSAALERLLAAWDRLTEATREWALEWGMALRSPAAAARIVDLLSTGGPGWRAALTHAAALPAGSLDTAALARLAGHAEPAVRAAAYRAGAAVADWSAALGAEPAAEVRRAMVRRLADDGARHRDLLAGLLADPDWRVRAGASEALVQQGPAAASALRAQLAGDSDAGRVAAAQALVRLGEEAWVQGALTG